MGLYKPHLFGDFGQVFEEKKFWFSEVFKTSFSKVFGALIFQSLLF